MTAKHRRLAVLGSPIEHSRSPQLHLAAYKQLGLNWSYERIELDGSVFEAFLAGLTPEWLGFSVTMPLKRVAFELADVVDPIAKRLGVANTLLLKDGRIEGFNTDVYGAARAIEQLGVTRPRSAAVLGSGSAARSVILALSELGMQSLSLRVRDTKSAGFAVELAESLGISVDLGTFDEALSSPDLVVSSLPGSIGLAHEFDRDIRENVPLLDIAYDPWPTPLATNWREAGGVAESGLSMLAHQAHAQVRTFVNGSPDSLLPDDEAVLSAILSAASG